MWFNKKLAPVLVECKSSLPITLLNTVPSSGAKTNKLSLAAHWPAFSPEPHRTSSPRLRAWERPHPPPGVILGRGTAKFTLTELQIILWTHWMPEIHSRHNTLRGREWENLSKIEDKGSAGQGQGRVICAPPAILVRTRHHTPTSGVYKLVYKQEEFEELEWKSFNRLHKFTKPGLGCSGCIYIRVLWWVTSVADTPVFWPTG